MAQTTGDSSKIEVWGSDRVAQGALPLVTPSQSTIEKGFVAGIASSNDLTYAPNLLGSKINHCLQNGVPLWNATTAYVVGNMVTHSNKAWQCLVNNTNSAPVDGNANWDKVLTVATPPSASSVLPSQTGNAGKVLTTDGTTPSWLKNTGAFAFACWDNTINANVTGTATRTGGIVNCNVVGHGHKVNHWAFFVFTGTISNSGWYKVTGVTDANNFSISFAGADVVTPASLTLRRRPIFTSTNVANIPTNATNDSGNFQVVNLINPAPTANYATVCQAQLPLQWCNNRMNTTSSNDNTFSDISFRVFAFNSSNGSDLGYSRGNVAVFT